MQDPQGIMWLIQDSRGVKSQKRSGKNTSLIILTVYIFTSSDSFNYDKQILSNRVLMFVPIYS